MRLTRRRFLQGTAAGAAALVLPGCASSRPRGANEDIRIGVVGLHGRGRDHVAGFRKLAGVRVVALCDVDSAVLEKARDELASHGQRAAIYRDVRQLLEARDVDAISVATPNHWHALIAVWACQAGKDVYLEKPVSHDIAEGRKVVDAAAMHERIVAAGTQSRSNPGLREAIAWVQSGQLGAIQLAHGLCYKRRRSIGKVKSPTVPPASVDYDLWCGPAPLVPLMRTNLHYDWHWVWPTGNGDLGNQGIHQMDMARWVLQQPQLASSVLSIGARVGYVDDAETPNTQIVLLGYEPAPLLFEVRGLPRSKADDKVMDRYLGADIGVVVHCEHGHLTIPSYSTAIAYDATGHEVQRFAGEGDHFANFIAAVQSRRPHDLNAGILEGHLSSALCHMGNLSHRLGQSLPCGEIQAELDGNPRLGEAFERVQRHLVKNGLEPRLTPLTLGASLRLDPARERFLDDERANALLTREYRAPFVMPEVV